MTESGTYNLNGSSGTNYQIGGSKTNVIIRAASILTTKPTITYTSSAVGTTSAMFNSAIAGLTLTFDGIEFNGSNSSTGAKPLLFIANATAYSCSIIMRNCYVHDFLNATGNGVIRLDGYNATTGTYGSTFDIQGTTFNNCSGRMFMFNPTANPNNSGNVTLKNNTFCNITASVGSQNVIFYNKTATCGTITIDHCTVYNFAASTDGIIKLAAAGGTITVTNSIFVSVVPTIPTSTIDYCYLAGFSTPPTGTHTIATAPTFDGAPTFNFGLTSATRANFIGSDAQYIGNTSTYTSSPSVSAGAVSPTSSGFTAQWGTVANASNYDVYVYTSPGNVLAGSSPYRASGQATASKTISDLSSSSKYTYKVIALGNQTNFSNSDLSTSSAEITTASSGLTKLTSPTNMASGSITTTGFRANWDAVSHASSYTVKVFTYPGGVQVGANQTNISTNYYDVSSLTANTAYTFTVTAVGDGTTYSDSDPASSTNFSTSALSKLSTPTATAATSYTATGFTANWTTVANALSYTVVVNQGGSVFNTTTGINQSTSSLVITGLTAGLSYTYTITAKGDNVSIYSDSDNSTSPSSYTSSTSGLLTAFDVNSTGFTAYWSPISNATSYTVNVYQGGDLVSTATASGQTASSAIITGLKTGLVYTYTVTGSDGFVSSSSSTITTQTPSILENFQDWTDQTSQSLLGGNGLGFTKTLNNGTSGTFTSNSLTVAHSQAIGANGTGTGNGRPSVGRIAIGGTSNYFILPALTNASTITLKASAASGTSGYKLQSSPDGSTWSDVSNGSINLSSSVTTANTFNISSSGTEYIKIIPLQAGSVFINDLQVNPYISATKLASPTVGTASAIIATGFTANWSTITNALGYYVRVYQGATLLNTTYVDGQTAANLVITGLTTNSTYSYKVIARGDVTNCSSSDASSLSGSVVVSNPLTTPTIGVASSILAESFTANWTAVSNASAYTVKVYDTTPTLIKSVTVSGQSSNAINITGLTLNTGYTYTVTATGDGTTYNDSGESQKSSGFTTLSSYPATISTNFGDGTWGTVYSSGNAPSLGFYPVYAVNGFEFTHAYIQSGTSSGGLKGEVHTNSLRLDKTSNSAVLYSPVVASAAQIEIHSTATTGKQLVVEVSSNGGAYSTVGTITASGSEQIDIFTVSSTNAKFRFTNISTGQYLIYQIITRTTAPALLSAPTVGTASGITSTGFTANWTPTDANATGYKVFVYNGSTLVNSYTSTDGQAASSLAITGLTANTAYAYKVLSRGDNDVNYSDSYLSTSASFTTLLASPTIGTASAITTSSFTANWTAVSSASSYDINVYQGASLISTTNASGQSTVSLNISGLSSNTAYTYKVIAKGNGTSTFNSAESTASASFSTTSTVSTDYFRSKTTGNWSDAGTWESSSNNTNWGDATSAPGSSANAISILNGYTVSITGNLTLSSLVINSGGILNLNAGKQLTVSTALANNGTINLLSNASGTATILTPNSITGSGTASVQQYLPIARNWYMASPVSGATGLPTVDTGSLIFYSYPENDANQSASGAYWNTVSSGTMAVGTGYIVKPSVASTITFSGTSLNTGDKTISGLTNSTTNNPLKHGFNLIGNPYPSYLNVLPALNGNSNLETTVWYRTRDTNTTPLYHFETVNATTGVGTNASGTGRVSGYIPPMQAFWVRTDLDNQSITLLNSNRSHSKNDVSMTDFPNTPTTSLKTPSTKESSYSLLGLNISNGSYGDETIVMFDPAASNGLDAYDSGKMSNGNINIPELFTIVGGSQLAINGMNNIPYDTEIPLGFTTGLAGTFTIKASQINNFDSSTSIYLKDNDDLLNTPVQLNSDAVYSFSSAVTTNNTSRFALIFKAPSIATSLNPMDNSNVWISTNANNQIVVNGGNSVEAYNAVGQKLAVKNLNATTTVLETPLQSGVYFVAVGNGAKSLIRKVIIK